MEELTVNGLYPQTDDGKLHSYTKG